ncbi:Nramp family divalent metal transporter [Streptomyces sp. NPDC017254]|uniref:Nramp family divalent metal transporter n=1 Tax=unclassified Streptomyces TaxID=2593676 RepID=UPI0037ADCFEF
MPASDHRPAGTVLDGKARRSAEGRVGRSAVTRAVMLGPAFVAAVAYVDPGNFATNFTAGAHYGHRLLWVVLVANVAGLFFQVLAAKLGVATGRDLMRLCRDRYPRPVAFGLWAQAEAVAVATDLAEIIGGALALHMLLGTPMLLGGVITALVSFALLHHDRRGRRRFDWIVAGSLLGIAGAMLWLATAARPGFSELSSGLVPGFEGRESLMLATGIIGATVMPHAIFLHSARSAERVGTLRRAGILRAGRDERVVLRGVRFDVTVAMVLAGVVNAAMLVGGAHLAGGAAPLVETLEDVRDGLRTSLGGGVALAFCGALLISGLASSSVGTYAGQVIMTGFLRRHPPLMVRRVLTVLPALLILAAGADPTAALVWSQVVLSFGLPFALVPLLLFTRDRELMGSLVNRRLTTVCGAAAGAAIICLNLSLLLP